MSLFHGLFGVDSSWFVYGCLIFLYFISYISHWVMYFVFLYGFSAYFCFSLVHFIYFCINLFWYWCFFNSLSYGYFVYLLFHCSVWVSGYIFFQSGSSMYFWNYLFGIVFSLHWVMYDFNLSFLFRYVDFYVIWFFVVYGNLFNPLFILFVCSVIVSWHSFILETSWSSVKECPYVMVHLVRICTWVILRNYTDTFLLFLWVMEIYYVFYSAFYLFYECVLAFVNPWTWPCVKECPYVMVHLARVCTRVFIRYMFVCSLARGNLFCLLFRFLFVLWLCHGIR